MINRGSAVNVEEILYHDWDQPVAHCVRRSCDRIYAMNIGLEGCNLVPDISLWDTLARDDTISSGWQKSISEG